jgi:hypothetical protein
VFMPVSRPAIRPRGPDAVATPHSPRLTPDTARALHARLLGNASARRLRGIERRARERHEDAEYWLGGVGFAVSKARDLRLSGHLPALP